LAAFRLVNHPARNEQEGKIKNFAGPFLADIRRDLHGGSAICKRGADDKMPVAAPAKGSTLPFSLAVVEENCLLPRL
jgi:hypothetical protein